MSVSSSYATEEKGPPNPNNVKVVPQVDETTKNPPSQLKIAPQYVSRDDENEQAEQNLQSCDGIPASIVVEPRVQQFLGCKIIQVLAQPERVESFKVKSNKNPNLPPEIRLGEYPIEPDGQGRNLNDMEIKNLQGWFFAEKNYHFGMEKRCRFRPDMGLHFVKGDEAVEVLFSFSCNLWLFVYKEEEKLEDFDPVQTELTALRDSLFP